MPLKEAAAVLGVSKDAVRQRVRRGTLRSDKGEDGRVYVYLDDSVDDVYAAKPPPASEAAGDDLLHRQMQARIDDLREQLRREQDAHAEARRIIAGLVQRIPELEAPREAEARETPETATAETEGTSPRSDSPGPQRPAERPQSGTLRGLRRRILGW